MSSVFSEVAAAVPAQPAREFVVGSAVDAVTLRPGVRSGDTATTASDRGVRPSGGVGVAVAVAVALGVGSAVITAALGVGVVAAVGAADEQAASARTAARESRRCMVVPFPCW